MERESLTKENFWNDISEKYPLAMDLFGNWINDYKTANNWDVLFNSKFKVVETATSICSSPKFHDLPCAIQQGIWIEFGMEVIRDYFGKTEYCPSTDFKNDVLTNLSDLEKTLEEFYGK